MKFEFSSALPCHDSYGLKWSFYLIPTIESTRGYGISSLSIGWLFWQLDIWREYKGKNKI